MVEIVRRGKLPEEEKFEKTCPNCKTFFRFLRRELKTNVPRDQRDISFNEIDCPVCKKPCFVSEQDKYKEVHRSSGGYDMRETAGWMDR